MGQDTRADSADPVDALLAVLRADGGRATLARRLLLTVLTGNRGHRTAGQIAADVQARAPGTNLSTIYRNLDELCRLGVIDRTRIGDGPASYHLAAPGHAHLACEHCGTVTETAGRGGWWADPVVGLGIAATAAWEGLQSWRGGDCC